MKVSIIVPVYNGERYIERCLESILSQSYKEIEVIIVDDGSMDNSKKILEKFLERRVKLYTKKNEGVSKARNFGIEKATGDLILFVDIDDYIDREMVSKLVEKVGIKEKTFILCDNLEIYKSEVFKRKLFESKEIDKEMVIREIGSGKAGLVCSKLISKKILEENKIRFNPQLKFCEDQIFFLEVAEKAEEFKYIGEELYFYDRRNEESSTRKYQENLLENFLLVQEEIKEIFKRNQLNQKEDLKILERKTFDFYMVCFLNEVRHKSMSKLVKALYEINFKMKGLIVVDEDDRGKSIYKYIKRNINIKKMSIYKQIVLGKILVFKNG